MGRIVTPKVHVEVFRPTFVVPQTPSGRQSTLKPDFRLKPNQLTYVRVVDIEDRRVKGIQFEETALFGGFIEINIAEDPTSELFDRFSPNDHVEVFYEDFNNLEKTPLFKTGANNDYTYLNSPPKFQGATWKTDLKYRPTMVTTQLHAWDYLRLMQYINIPRGKKQPAIGTVVREFNSPDGESKGFRVKKQREKYGDNLLDYVDSALDTFVSSNEVSIFGERVLNIEIENIEGAIGLEFSDTSNTRRYGNGRPKVQLYTAGIGNHCHRRMRSGDFGSYKEVKFSNNQTWSNRGFHRENSVEKIIDGIDQAINNMEIYDMMIFRFLDGNFQRFAGVVDPSTGEVSYQNVGHIAADIVVISQFALMDLLLKKITYDHGINEWFTPILDIDTELTESLKEVGDQIGQRVSKLVYVRLRRVEDSGEETSQVVFNMDTFPFITEATQEIFNRAIGNLKNNAKEKFTKNDVDIFIEAISSTQFPQPNPTEGNIFSLKTLIDNLIEDNKIKNHREAYKDLLNRFDEGFPDSTFTEFSGSSDPLFFKELLRRTSQYATLIQKILQKDNKLISFIGAIPASFMRADIYTGSKFNTMQYDSLAITRIIQILASTMAGFPLTNSPQSNTKTGKIDSYPIFAANRIVIKPKAYFGTEIDNGTDRSRQYIAFSSLTEAINSGQFDTYANKDQIKATCFLVLDVAKKQLKDKGEKPDFIIPIEDVQDFGMIKASTVNHYFNFSLADYFKNTKFSESFTEGDTKKIFNNVITNGFFMQYREEGVEMAGFSPPEHQHLTLADLTQDEEYDSWAVRAFTNGNVDGNLDSSKPILHPLNAYSSTFSSITSQPEDKTKKYFIINDYDNFKPIEVYWSAENLSTTKLNLIEDDRPIDFTGTTIEPFHGITHYLDITDLKTEYKTLLTILEDEDISYRGITNVGIELMKNIFIRAPLKLFVDNSEGVSYEKRISISGAPGQSRVRDYENLETIVKNISEELDKISEIDMHWLFPYRGYKIDVTNGEIYQPDEIVTDISTNTIAKHFYLVVYLDTLIKGIRYMLWTIAKARYFAHIYLPIEYESYAKHNAEKTFNPVIEPGSSIEISYKGDNSLNTSLDPPLVSFKIRGLTETKFKPLTRTIAKETSAFDNFVQVEREEARQLTWYVSKKVTYIGADVGAMVRIEMTEGSLDWTLFYNEKNLLTQISEHYFLNGIGNFRAGGRI